MTNAWMQQLRYSRREALGGAIGAATLAAAAPAIAQAGGRRPNFLFIMADDLGYADLSCYGRREYRTEAIDRLAEQGTKFTHGYANSAVCSPTRVALITGRYQYRMRAGIEEPLGGPEYGLDPAHPTLPSLLRDSGYHTALIGKWHLGSLPRFGPLKSGYDEFWGNHSGGIDYFTHEMAGALDLWDGEVPVEESGYYTDLLGERALAFLDRRAHEEKAWLLSLHFTAPHWPWIGPDDRAESARVKALGDAAGEMRIDHFDGGDMETYTQMMLSLDHNVGRVLDHLSALGLDENTVVVFTSDNGGERFSDNWPFSGMKTELLEGGIRVPLIVRWPGLSVAGSQSEVPLLSMDFMPTFLAAAGTAPAPGHPSDGIDFRPALAGAHLAERTLFWRFGSKDQKAARRGRYKYLAIGGNEFLFDIIADPLERGNLRDREPSIFAGLKAAFDEWNTGMTSDPDARSYGITPDRIADRYDPSPS